MDILQYNIQSLKHIGNKDLLNHFLMENKIKIAALMETWLVDSSCTSLANFNYVGKNREDGFGGVGFYIDRGIKYNIVKYDTKFDILIISTLNLKRNFNVICVYMPPRLDVAHFEIEMKRLFFAVTGLKGTSIICGDFNAKSGLWRAGQEDNKGHILESIANEMGYLCLNDGSPTYATVNCTPSALDVTFAHNLFSEYKWTALKTSITASNHRPVITSLIGNFGIKGNKRILAKENFFESVRDMNIGESVGDFVSNVGDIRKRNTIVENERNKYIPKSWWNAQSSKLYRLRNAARSKYYHTGMMEDCLTYDKAEDELKRHIKKGRAESMNDLLEELSKTSDMKLLWRKMANLKKYKCPKRSNNSWDNDQSKTFLSKLTCEESDTDGQQEPTQISQNMEIPSFDYQDFIIFLSSRNPDSAPGKDGITYRLIVNLSDYNKRKLFNMIIENFKNCTFPDEWRNIMVCPVPKRGKDATQIENHRPICLMSTLLKSLEYLIKLHIEQHIGNLNYIPDRSYAYRRKRSTDICINDVINSVEIYKKNGLQVVGACLDVEKAYDNTDRKILCERLLELGINSHVVKWVDKFLSERILNLNGNTVVCGNGLAQGSILSPLLFNIYTTILHEIAEDYVRLFQYADDFFLVCAAASFEEAKDLLEEKIAVLFRECERLKLSFNPEKMSVIHFNRRPKTLGIHLNNVILPDVDTIKYLGRIVSSNGSSTQHVTQIIECTRKACQFINLLSSRYNGLTPKRSLQFYRVYIRSKIEYAASTFANISKKSLSKINSYLNGILRGSLGLIRSTPINTIYHMAAEMPLELRITLTTAKMIAKSIIFQLPLVEFLDDTLWNVDTSIIRTYVQYKSVFDDMGVITHQGATVRKLSCDLDFFKGVVGSKKDVDNRVARKFFSEKKHFLSGNDFEIFYTDGSVRGNHIGFAFTNDDGSVTESFHVRKVMSSTTAELLAIEKTIIFADNNGIEKIAILTDSKAAIYAIMDTNNNNYIAANIRGRLENSCIDLCEVHYVPGHIGIDGNERADCAAGNALRDGAAVTVGWTYLDAIGVIEGILKVDWQVQYDRQREIKGVEYGRMFPVVGDKPWFSDLNSDDIGRTEIRLANRILSGHAFCKATLAKMQVVDSELCDYCPVKEDVNHIIFRCGQYSVERADFPELCDSGSIEEFLQKHSIQNIIIIINFIKTINFNL